MLLLLVALPCSAAVITKARCLCQLQCEAAPLSNKLANPPYSIHNFGWKEGITNNDDNRVRAIDGNARSPLDLKGISVTASESSFSQAQESHSIIAC